mgnify:FL=1
MSLYKKNDAVDSRSSLIARQIKHSGIVQKCYLTSKEAAAYLNCSERHLFNLRNFYGKLKFYQFGRMVRFKQKDLDDFLEEYVMSPFDVKEGEFTELPIAQINRIY